MVLAGANALVRQLAAPCVFASSTKPQACPANSVAYAADDARPQNHKIACCALPTPDILDESSSPVVRSGDCDANEVMVGAGGGPAILCQKINTVLYKLGTATSACYYGHGASGSSGSGACGAPNKMLKAIGGSFGSDGCVANPGSVITGYRGKSCGGVSTRTLLRVADGKKVPFP